MRSFLDPSALRQSAPPSVYWFVLRPLGRSEEHTSELQSQSNLVCRLLLEKKKIKKINVVRYNLLLHSSEARSFVIQNLRANHNRETAGLHQRGHARALGAAHLSVDATHRV